MIPLAVFGARPAFPDSQFIVRPFLPSRPRIERVLNRLYGTRLLTNHGHYARKLELALANTLDVRHALVVSSATIGLQLLARALKLGGEAVMPSFTFVATAHAFRWEGLRPVFADIEPRYLTVDPESIDQKINRRTSVIVAVNLFGNPCDIEAIGRLGRRYGLPVIYDSAQALGSRYGRKRLGRHGTAEVFSLHATKIINGLEGGVITTNDSALASKLSLMRNFGFSGYDQVVSLGINAKMNELTAAVAYESLGSLDALIQRNKKVGENYRRFFGSLPGIRFLETRPGGRSNYNSFSILVDPDFGLTRDQLCDVLWKENIIARRYYYPGCHRQTPYLRRGTKHLEVTERVSGQILSLPCHSSLSRADQQKICSIVTNAHRFRERLVAHYAAHPIDARLRAVRV